MAENSSDDQVSAEMRLLQDLQKELHLKGIMMHEELVEIREFNTIERKVLTEENNQLNVKLQEVVLSGNSQLKEEFDYREKQLQTTFDLRETELKTIIERQEKEFQLKYDLKEKELMKMFENRENELKDFYEKRQVKIQNELRNEIDLSENATSIAMEDLISANQRNGVLVEKLNAANESLKSLKVEVETLKNRAHLLHSQSSSNSQESAMTILKLNNNLLQANEKLQSTDISFKEISSKYELLLESSEQLTKAMESKYEFLFQTCEKEKTDYDNKINEITIKFEEVRKQNQILSEQNSYSNFEKKILNLETKISELKDKNSKLDSTSRYLQQNVISKFYELEKVSPVVKSGKDIENTPPHIQTVQNIENRVKEERKLMLKFLSSKY